MVKILRVKLWDQIAEACIKHYTHEQLYLIGMFDNICFVSSFGAHVLMAKYFAPIFLRLLNIFGEFGKNTTHIPLQ